MRHPYLIRVQVKKAGFSSIAKVLGKFKFSYGDDQAKELLAPYKDEIDSVIESSSTKKEDEKVEKKVEKKEDAKKEDTKKADAKNEKDAEEKKEDNSSKKAKEDDEDDVAQDDSGDHHMPSRHDDARWMDSDENADKILSDLVFLLPAAGNSAKVKEFKASIETNGGFIAGRMSKKVLIRSHQSQIILHVVAAEP